ncbi:hypothetical protein KDW41_12580 [Burkholderia vietnamiensis]|nr:hypothetical protein [Burkholderia vietnamiensis]
MRQLTLAAGKRPHATRRAHRDIVGAARRRAAQRSRLSLAINRSTGRSYRAVSDSVAAVEIAHSSVRIFRFIQAIFNRAPLSGMSYSFAERRHSAVLVSVIFYRFFGEATFRD